jgi:hypothetical protein
MAAAQANPPPGFHERALAQTIRQAGHDCRAVESIDIAPNPDGGLDSFRPEVALCTNGKRFLVVKGERRSRRSKCKASRQTSASREPNLTQLLETPANPVRSHLVPDPARRALKLR